MIIKLKKKQFYTCIDNTLLQDPTLTLEQIGLMVHLLSHSETWNPNAKAISKKMLASKYKINQLLDSLINAGYIYKHVNSRDSTGMFVRTNTCVYENRSLNPYLKQDDSTITNEPTLTESQTCENGACENGAHNNNQSNKTSLKLLNSTKKKIVSGNLDFFSIFSEQDQHKLIDYGNELLLDTSQFQKVIAGVAMAKSSDKIKSSAMRLARCLLKKESEGEFDDDGVAEFMERQEMRKRTARAVELAKIKSLRQGANLTKKKL